MEKSRGTGSIGATLALFSMMFGAGNIVFPILLGEQSGSHTFAALLGFALGGVAIPFLGLIAMMLYEGDYRRFFGRLGPRAGFALYVILILVLGPIGSIPRLITVSFGTMKPYLPEMSPLLFSALCCAITFLFALRKTRILGLLAYLLTPILLLALALLIGKGLFQAEGALLPLQSASSSFKEGLEMGYSLLDLVASFLYSTLVLQSLRRGPNETVMEVGPAIRKGIIASIAAGSMLIAVYAGLAYVGAYHGAAVRGGGGSEEMVRAVSLAILGPWGGLVACVAVGLACLTTAVSLTVVCSNFLQSDILKGRGGYILPVSLTLGLSFLISNLGFTGIAKLIGPFLMVIHPALILLCLLNIAHRYLQWKSIRLPVYGALTLSLLLYFV